MKKILSILTIFGFSVQAMAQDIKVAPELGGTYQTMIQKLNGYNYQTNFQAGLRVGGIVDIGYNKNLSIQTGAFVNTNTGTQSYHEKFYALGSGLPTSDQDTRNYSITYIQVPVYALYKTGKEYDDPHFFIGAGPYFAAAIGGRFQQDYTNTLNGNERTVRKDDGIAVGNEKKDQIRPFDLGVQATLGYELPVGLYLRAFYGVGLLNTAPGGGSNNNFRSYGGGVTVGFFFNLTHRNSWD